LSPPCAGGRRGPNLRGRRTGTLPPRAGQARWRRATRRRAPVYAVRRPPHPLASRTRTGRTGSTPDIGSSPPFITSPLGNRNTHNSPRSARSPRGARRRRGAGEPRAPAPSRRSAARGAPGPPSRTREGRQGASTPRAGVDDTRSLAARRSADRRPPTCGGCSSGTARQGRGRGRPAGSPTGARGVPEGWRRLPETFLLRNVWRERPAVKDRLSPPTPQDLRLRGSPGGMQEGSRPKPSGRVPSLGP